MTGSGALIAALPRLRAAGVTDPVRDARVLLAHAIGIDRARLALVLPDPLDDAAQARFETFVAARVARQPVARIIGGRAFFGHWFRVTPDVLDPRPETETLVEQALSRPFGSVLDLGTGTGCILLSLLAERPGAGGTGSDVSDAALGVARLNAADLGLSARVTWVRSDWFQAVEGRFDLIVSNPPYIAAAEMPRLAPEVRDWEPHMALTPGGDGLDAYRAIAGGAVDHLAPEGRVVVEIGPTQAMSVRAMFAEAGLRDIAVIRDLDGRDRVVSARSRA